ncbi:M23 family metallopeptidase [Virgibacillus ihumii]|uniref:M23 family metallopeptidase n=1 Tax=Virgibacillus ihumii TaxID=2686091 RepID=UPI00157C2D8B|nr:M23 family metallopeptidase [Virgibacillus ihumii]
MKLKRSLLVLVAVSLLPFSVVSGQPVNWGQSGEIITGQEKFIKKKYRILPEEFGAYFLQEHFSKIYQQTSEEFRRSVSFSKFEKLADSFNQEVKSYELQTRLSIDKHVRRYVWVTAKKTKGIQVVFDKHGIIQALQLVPLMSFPKTDRIYTNNEYTMPVKVNWMVFWGGTNQLINYHYLSGNQRYAYDLVMMKNGRTHHGNPKKNKHYYAFGEEVAAPADGKVIQVVEDVKDNIPGEMNAKQPLGNHVIIEHENGEYSLLAHLKEHSISVNVGDYVERGEVLGICGNSGNSSEPHIHFQVMDSPDFSEGNSVRIQFKSGKEPIQGDIVKPIISFRNTVDYGD